MEKIIKNIEEGIKSGIEKAEKSIQYEDKLVMAMAHRVCHSAEHNPENGRIHGYCMVCGIPWPCETAENFLYNKEPKK